MKNYAQIKNTIVINLIVVDENDVPDWLIQDGYIQSDTANIGDSYIDGQFVPYSQPQKTPTEIQEKVNTEARAYLASTDWYVVRFIETGVAIPAEITTARQEARESVKPLSAE